MILPILERYYYPPQPPDPEFFARLQRILPELRKLVMPTMSKVAAEIRQELTPKIEPVVAGVFEGRSS